MNYNLVVDSTFAAPNELADLVYEKFQGFCRSCEESRDIVMSPTSLYPLPGYSDVEMSELDFWYTF